MRRNRHATHIFRVAVLFLAGASIFLVARRALIPADFGTLGFYRAGAIDDVKARKIVYAGSKACDECHEGIYTPEVDDAATPSKASKAALDLAATEPQKDNKHSVLRCEACHGPMAFHIDDLDKPVPTVGADKLCLGCHRQITGRPASHPQVLPGDHGDNDPCVSCHRPHRPRTDEDKG